MDHLSEEEGEYQAYCRKVELSWSLARGCQIIVSPLEFEEIDRWHEAGIPLPVVLRAIDLFIEKKRKSKRKRNFLLKDAGTTVDKCWQEYKDIHAGQGEDGDLLENKMKALIRKLRKLAKDWPQHGPHIQELTEQLQAIPLAEIANFDSLDASLGALDTCLVQHFCEEMATEDLAEIKDEVSEFLSEEEDPEFFAKMLNDAVRSHFQLPKLTLLG